MLRLSVLIVLFFKLTSAIVVHKNQYSNDGPASIPTELYKPLQPVIEQSVSSDRIPQMNNKQVSNNPFENFSELGNFKGYSVVTTYSSDNGLPTAAQIQELKPVHTETRFESLNNQNPLILKRWNTFPHNEGFATNPGIGHFQISARSSYFNSETMSEPEIRHYNFDSRNQGTSNNFFIS